MNPAVRQLLFSAPFTPARLFRAGEQGAWFDPSDFATMWQDSAGTAPVTAVGQPVGLMLDKRLGAARGPELYAGGNIAGVAIGGPAFTNYSLGINTVIGRCYDIAITVTGYSGSGTLSFAGTSGTDFVGIVSTTGNGLWTVKYTALSVHTISVFTRSTNTANFTNISVKELPGNHAAQSTAASRPILQQDASGFSYLAFDGVDDGLATGSVNFSATDKMTVCAGVYKASDAARGMLVELSSAAGNAGIFHIDAPASDIATASYGFLNTGGSTAGTRRIATTYTAPLSNVLTGTWDLSNAGAASNASRINGVVPTLANNLVTSTAGAFGNYPLYIGRRGGTTLPFNGRLYGLIVRGAATDATTLSRAERHVGQKMGIAL